MRELAQGRGGTCSWSHSPWTGQGRDSKPNKPVDSKGLRIHGWAPHTHGHSRSGCPVLPSQETKSLCWRNNHSSPGTSFASTHLTPTTPSYGMCVIMARFDMLGSKDWRWLRNASRVILRRRQILQSNPDLFQSLCLLWTIVLFQGTWH